MHSYYAKLLDYITSEDVKEIIHEHDTIIQKGIQLCYFIDPHDLNRYCFPFGLTKSKDERENRPVSVIVDEQVAYYFLFDTVESLLLFDEHAIEYQGFRNSVSFAKDKGLDTIDSLSTLVDSYHKNINCKLDKLNEPINWLSCIDVNHLLSVLLGLMSDGYSRLNDFENNQRTYDHVEMGKRGFSQEIITLISRTRASQLSINVYNKIDELLIRLDSSSNVKKNIWMNPLVRISRFRDCQVFDRLIHINNSCTSNTFFLLLSSAQSAKSIQSLSKSIQPELFKYGLNPLRNIKHIYIKLLCHVNNDDAATRVNYSSLYEYVLSKEINWDINKRQFLKPEHDWIVTQTNGIPKRPEFQKCAILGQYAAHRDSFNKLVTSASLNNQDLYEDLIHLVSLAWNDDNISKAKELSLQEMTYEYNFWTTLITGLEAVTKLDFNICAFKGDDEVYHKYHHMPVVFNLSKEAQFSRILDEYIEFVFDENQEIDALRSLVKNIYVDISFIQRNSDETIKVDFIRCLIMLILPKNDKCDPQFKALDRLLEIFNDVDPKEDKAIYLDVLYVISWIYRRTRDYPNAVQFAEYGIKIDNEDARFYHSLCLINYCKYNDDKDNDYRNVKILDSAASQCKIAVEKYAVYDKSIAVVKTREILCNSLCYINCIIYDVNKYIDSEKIIVGREFFDILKSMNPYYSRHHEFLHTESYLLYLEFFYCGKDNKELLLEALKKIEIAIELTPDNFSKLKIGIYIKHKEDIELLLTGS